MYLLYFKFEMERATLWDRLTEKDSIQKKNKKKENERDNKNNYRWIKKFVKKYGIVDNKLMN